MDHRFIITVIGLPVAGGARPARPAKAIDGWCRQSGSPIAFYRKTA